MGFEALEYIELNVLLQIGLAVSLENKGKICHSNEHIQVQLNYFEGREEKGKPQQSSNANRSRENKDIRLTIVNTVKLRVLTRLT